MTLELSSTAFAEGKTIPSRHTGDGPDLSPELKWSDPPEGTESFALICEDPDAPRGTWTHWVVFNIPGKARALSEGVPRQPALGDGTVQGTNDFGKIGYGGPAPPPGKPHRYFFRIYAVDSLLELPKGARKEQVIAALRGHMLAEGQLMGTYGRFQR